MSDRYRTGRRRRENNKKKIIIGTSVAAAAVVAGVAVFFAFGNNGGGNTRMSPEKYFKQSAGDTEAILVSEGTVDESTKGLKKDGTVYIPQSYVSDYIDTRFYYDSESAAILYTDGVGTMTLAPGKTDYTTTTGETKTAENAPIIEENGTIYIDMAFIDPYVDGTLEVYENPNRVVYLKGETSSEVKANDVVRYYAGPKSDILTDVVAGDKVVWLEEEEGGYTKVQTKDGFQGYIKSSSLSASKNEPVEKADIERACRHKQFNGNISLGFLQVTNDAANNNVEGIIKETAGAVNVAAPTWYAYADSKGTISDLSYEAIVSQLHESGVQVWPVVNDFKYDVDIEQLLSSKRLRQRMVKRLVSDAVDMNYDGINIDFEKITSSSSDDYLQFIRELSLELRKNDKYLSVDVYPIEVYNAFYNPEEIANYADYVIVMNYDEHYSGSEKAGPVSSMSYVERNLKRLSEYVPSEQIINALPFYTRLWKESNGELSDDSISMVESQAVITESGATPTYDDDAGSNYIEYKDSTGATFKMWIEDKDTLGKKIDLTKENNNGGSANVAYWRLGLENEDVWQVVNEKLFSRGN